MNMNPQVANHNAAPRHRYNVSPRRRFLRRWGRMVAELRALNDAAVDVSDSPMVLDGIERLLGDAESLAVVMCEPGVYRLVPRPFT